MLAEPHSQQHHYSAYEAPAWKKKKPTIAEEAARFRTVDRRCGGQARSGFCYGACNLHSGCLIRGRDVVKKSAPMGHGGMGVGVSMEKYLLLFSIYLGEGMAKG